MYRYITLIFSFGMLFLCNSCQKWFAEKDYKYEVLKDGNPQNLVFLYYGPNIVGIDTTTFTVEARVRMSNMSIGGVTKLPNGGIAFTHERRVSDNAWGNTLYVTDDKYNIVGKYPVCLSPMAPKVVNNVLMVGSSGIEEDGKMKFQLYDVHNFTLIKEFLFEDMVDAWRIFEYDNRAYFGVPVNMPSAQRRYSYIVELDLNAGTTAEFFSQNDFFRESAHSIWRQDSVLYVFNIGSKDVCTINLNSKEISQAVKISQYPQISAINALNCFHPKYVNGHLYVFFGQYGYAANDSYVCHWVKLNANTFELEDIKKLDIPFGDGYTGPSYNFHAGRFYVLQTAKNVLFIDTGSGKIMSKVFLDVDYF